jgi:HAD superfamily hydrolase (TIGR01509 family)
MTERSVPTRGSRRWSAAALFDWDGTLVDSRQALLAAWHDVTRKHLGGRWPLEEDDVRLVLSRRGSEIFPRLSEDPAVVQALERGFTPAYERHAAEGVRPFPGALELLADLRERDVAVGVVTSKARVRYVADADRARLGHLVTAVACAEDVARGKPDPQAVHQVLEALEVPADRAVVVGDTVVDVATGRSAGVRTIGVTWGSTGAGALVTAGADRVVTTFDELRSALRDGPLAV